MSTSPQLASNSLTPGPEAASERRVLVVVRWPVGGIRTHVLYNYPRAAGQGHRFTFIGPADKTFDTFASGLAALPGSEFVGVPVRGSRCLMTGAVREQLGTGRFALMHSHGLTAAVQAAAANIGINLPHAATVHDPLRPEQFRGVRGWVKRRAMSRMLGRLEAVVCVGQDVRANLREYLTALDAERLIVIPNGIDTDRFTAYETGGDDLRDRLGLEQGVAVLGFLGRFMEQKGFLPLLAAMQQLVAEGSHQPFHLVAVGSGDFEREYRAEVKKRGLLDHVTMLGFMMDVRPLMRQLDVLVMPSLWEASPLLPMEAMTAGIPVLGTDCIGLREVLRDTPSRVVRTGDVPELCHGLRDALANPWTEAARDYAPAARARFDNRPSAQRLVELFGGLTRRSAAA